MNGRLGFNAIRGGRQQIFTEPPQTRQVLVVGLIKSENILKLKTSLTKSYSSVLFAMGSPVISHL
jgi:hypothetical protein